MVDASVSAIGYFMPIFAFLLVFIIVYALLKKTEVLGSSEAMMLLISFILATFFIVEASLVEFVTFSSSWMVVGIFMIFFVMLVVAFVPGIEVKEFFGKGNWFAWVLLSLPVL